MPWTLSLFCGMSTGFAPQAVLWSSVAMEDTSQSLQWPPSAEWLLPTALERWHTNMQYRFCFALIKVTGTAVHPPCVGACSNVEA